MEICEHTYAELMYYCVATQHWVPLTMECGVWTKIGLPILLGGSLTSGAEARLLCPA
jgi:hypothetical protein